MSKLRDCFVELKELFTNYNSSSNKSISSYELSISGLVQILLLILTTGSSESKLNERNRLFAEIFIADKQENESHHLLLIMLRKLTSLFESIERLPLYLYDAPGSYNLQAFSKRFKLILNKGGNDEQDDEQDYEENNLLDFSGRILKVEPLANISHLEKYISKMVIKQWYDYGRKSLTFLTALQQRIDTDGMVEFKYESEFDENGLIYWIGTNGKTRSSADWINPHSHNNLVRMSCSESTRQFQSGRLDDVIGRQAISCHTSGDEKRIWIAMDLGMCLIPTHYTLRYSKPMINVNHSRTAPRNWAILGSRTGGSTLADWDILYIHSNDDKLREHGAAYTWHLAELSSLVKTELEKNGPGWRYFRLQQTGRNQSGSSSYVMSVSGLEFYGQVKSVIMDEELRNVTISSSSTRIIESSRSKSSSSSSHKKSSRSTGTNPADDTRLAVVSENVCRQVQLGARVIRGSDWKWGDQDQATPVSNDASSKDDKEAQPPTATTTSTAFYEGTVISEANAHNWVEVIWDNGVFNFYRMGYENKYDLALGPSHDLAKLNTYYALAMQNLAISKANSSFYMLNSISSMCSTNNDNYEQELNTSKTVSQPPVLISFTTLDNENHFKIANDELNSNNIKSHIVKDRKSSSTPVLAPQDQENVVNRVLPLLNQNLTSNKDELNSNQTLSAIHVNDEEEKEETISGGDKTTNSNTSLLFRGGPPYYSLTSSSQTNSLGLDQAHHHDRHYNLLLPKKQLMQRHYSLQSTHDKSQSANNLLSFVINPNNDLTAVSEPNVLMNESNQPSQQQHGQSDKSDQTKNARQGRLSQNYSRMIKPCLISSIGTISHHFILKY